LSRVDALSLLKQSCITFKIERPTSLAINALANAFPAFAMAVEVAVLEFDPGPLRRFGYEPNLYLARPCRVGLDLPTSIDVPANDDTIRRLVGQNASPTALAAIDSAVE
jgi:hypothetical protein